MSILVDYVFECNGCHDVAVTEHGPVHPGEAVPSASLPSGWHAVDDLRLFCSKCSKVPVQA